MYKILSIILAGLLVVAGIFYVYERYTKNKMQDELNNQLAQLSKTLKETETAYSKLGLQVDNIKAENKQLQKIIDKKNEEIVALNEVVLHWKDLYFKILNASGGVVDPNTGEVIPVEPDCEKCLQNKSFKVEFSQTQDYLKISGYTLYNYQKPSQAFIDVKWVRDLKLTIILTKNKNVYKAYVDTNSSDVVPSSVELKVDPSVFDIKWYQRLGVGANVGLGDGLMVGLNAYVQIFNNILVGPSFVNVFNGKDYMKFYGANVGWFPFR